MDGIDESRIAVVVLAAGKSSRMGGPHKLLARFEGVPLVRKVAMEAIESDVGPVIVVTGYRREDIEAVLSGLPLQMAYAADYASGMGRSLAEGVRVANECGARGVMVVLGDMPGVTAGIMQSMAEAFRVLGGAHVVRANSNGQAGHPTVLPRSLYDDLRKLEGDMGARDLLKNSPVGVVEVELGAAVLRDVNTPADIVAVGGEVCA